MFQFDFSIIKVMALTPILPINGRLIVNQNELKWENSCYKSA